MKVKQYDPAIDFGGIDLIIGLIIIGIIAIIGLLNISCNKRDT
jgi:hypothetical protein